MNCSQSAATLQIYFAAKGIFCRYGGGGVGFMAWNHGVALPAVIKCPAISYQQSVIVPLVTQNVHQKVLIGAAGDAVESVVAAHNLLHVAVADNVFKSGQIGGPKVAGRHFGIKLMAHSFRATMHSQMFQAGSGNKTGGVATLQPSHCR